MTVLVAVIAISALTEQGGVLAPRLREFPAGLDELTPQLIQLLTPLYPGLSARATDFVTQPVHASLKALNLAQKAGGLFEVMAFRHVVDEPADLQQAPLHTAVARDESVPVTGAILSDSVIGRAEVAVEARVGLVMDPCPFVGRTLQIIETLKH